MAKVMTVKLDGKTHELGPCETAGAVHVVALTQAGRTFYLANKPDTQLVTLHGDMLHVRAQFIRHSPDWRVVGDGPGSAPDKPAAKPVSAPAEPAVIDADDESTDDGDRYAGLKKPELQELCDARELKRGGTVAELIERLREHDLNG